MFTFLSWQRGGSRCQEKDFMTDFPTFAPNKLHWYGASWACTGIPVSQHSPLLDYIHRYQGFQILYGSISSSALLQPAQYTFSSSAAIPETCWYLLIMLYQMMRFENHRKTVLPVAFHWPHWPRHDCTNANGSHLGTQQAAAKAWERCHPPCDIEWCHMFLTTVEDFRNWVPRCCETDTNAKRIIESSRIPQKGMSGIDLGNAADMMWHKDFFWASRPVTDHWKKLAALQCLSCMRTRID